MQPSATGVGARNRSLIYAGGEFPSEKMPPDGLGGGISLHFLQV